MHIELKESIQRNKHCIIVFANLYNILLFEYKEKKERLNENKYDCVPCTSIRGTRLNTND